MTTSLRGPRARRLVGTVLAVVIAFAVGLGVTKLLSRREAARADRRALSALAQEVDVFPAPPGAAGPRRDRAALCCSNGACIPHFSRHDRVAATGSDLAAFYRRAFQREGWLRQSYSEPATEYFEKELAGRRVTGSFRVDPGSGSASVAFHLEPRSC